MSTFFDEMIHIMTECNVHLHNHKNKVMSLMKPYILANFNNSANFHSYTY